MPIIMVRKSITKMQVDAIVNTTDTSLLMRSGISGRIHRSAGVELLEECQNIGGCNIGEAKITGAGSLPCKYVIHTALAEGNVVEDGTLVSCYQNVLLSAKQNKYKSIAFPISSSTIFGYTQEQVFRIALSTIRTFLVQNDLIVYLVFADKKDYKISYRLFDNIKNHIDRNQIVRSVYSGRGKNVCKKIKKEISIQEYSYKYNKEENLDMLPVMSAPKSLNVAISQIDESFSEMLLRKIDEKGMKDAECYKRANIDRKLFSKIRSDKLYKPSKSTAIAFAIALELSLTETQDMLMKAGFALSNSNKFDIIVRYFIENANYNVFEINEALFAFDQSLLGA